MTDVEQLIQTGAKRYERAGFAKAIYVDNESDIVCAVTEEEIVPIFSINEITGRQENVVQHFMFPKSPKQNTFPRAVCKCSGRTRDWFRPITPQISARSLRENLLLTSTRNSNAFHEADNFCADEPLMSLWSAGFAIINVYLGMGLLSFPYAMSQGGLISLVFLAVIGCFMCWTGKLLVRCFARMRPSKRTYIDVGNKSFGRYGSGLVAFGVIFEFFGGFCVSLIFLWQNCFYFLDSLSYDVSDLIVVLVCCIAAVPICWILDLSEMSFVSFSGSISKIMTVLVVALCFFLNFDTAKHNVESDALSLYPKNLQSLSVCLGIFVLSFAGHSVLPAIYNGMAQPERFESLLNRCFVSLFFIYAAMALCGYLSFADDTNVLITQNLLAVKVGDDGSNASQMFISKMLVMLVIIGLYFQCAPVLSLLAEIPEMVLFEIKSKLMQRVFRTALFVVGAALSYFIMNELAVLEAMTGVCTVITAVVCPTMFYFAIYRNYTRFAKRMLLILCAITGVVCGLFMLFNDISSLLS